MHARLKKIFNYYGGKYFMLNDIYRLILNYYNPITKEHKLSCFVDVFGGSGTVLLNLPKELGHFNKVFNDIDSRIYNLMVALQDENQRKEIEERFNYALRSREYFEMLKKKDEQTPFEFLYLLACSFNADANTFSTYSKSPEKKFNVTFKNALNNWKYIKDWTLEKLDFREIIPKYDTDETFFYLDPPYLTGGAAYKFKFTKEDFIDLKNILDKVKGKWLLNESEIDFDFIKSVFGEPKMVKRYSSNFVTRYSMENGIKKPPRLEGFWTNF